MGEISVRAPPEGSPAEDELVYADPKRPPVDRVRVTFLDEDFWSHISHRARHASEHLAFRIMDGDIEIGQVGVPLFIQKDVIRFDVPVLVRYGPNRGKRTLNENSTGMIRAPVDNAFLVQV